MSAISSQITGISIVCPNANSGAVKENIKALRRLESTDSPHKGLVTRKRIPFDDVIMWSLSRRVTRKYTYE